jgi:cob(I)alamin adenosyltransferase
MEKGYVHVLTGNGKGKTTSAIGISVKAAGSGLKVFFSQFVKKGEYSEIKAFKRFPDQIKLEQFGLGRFTDSNPALDDINAANTGLERVKEVINKNEYDLVILDEANVAVKLGLMSVQKLVSLIINKPHKLNMVITGRYASPRIIELADIVTEMKVIKHYFKKGVAARVGIEK